MLPKCWTSLQQYIFRGRVFFQCLAPSLTLIKRQKQISLTSIFRVETGRWRISQVSKDLLTLLNIWKRNSAALFSVSEEQLNEGKPGETLPGLVLF
jgi:hypothetical protein